MSTPLPPVSLLLTPLTLWNVHRVKTQILDEIVIAYAEWRADAIDSNIHCYAPRRRNVFVCFAAVQEKRFCYDVCKFSRQHTSLLNWKWDGSENQVTFKIDDEHDRSEKKLISLSRGRQLVWGKRSLKIMVEGSWKFGEFGKSLWQT